MQNHRCRSPRSPPAISKPIPVDEFAPVSPPMAPPRQRGGSISNPMAWLTRTASSSSHAAPYTPSKPVRISEPKFLNSLDSLTQQRNGVLGTGATVVRTPQEALAGPGSLALFQAEVVDDDIFVIDHDAEPTPSYPIRPESPPLPPLPDAESPICESVRSRTPPRPTRPPPAAPESPESDITVLDPYSPEPETTTLRPSLKSRSPNLSTYSPPMPAMPANISSSPPQSPFEPILISPLPTELIDHSKVIVSLETSTMTHRTTMNTLTSRPSFLSTYLKELLPSRKRDSDAVSIESDYSEATSSFNSIFHHHLTTSGLLPQASTCIHIFLDRPSAPYAHILAYLRSPPSTPENPAMLPRAVQLTSSSSARLETLLELRDEARYLDLDELYKLCNDEIRLRTSRPTGLGLHMRGLSSASTTSLRSMTTLRDVPEYESKLTRAVSKDSTKAAKRSPKSGTGGALPDPQQRGRATTRTDGVETLRARPHPGWI